MKKRLQAGLTRLRNGLRNGLRKPLVWLPLAAATLLIVGICMGVLTGGAGVPAVASPISSDDITAAVTTETTASAPRYTVCIRADGGTVAHTVTDGTVESALAAFDVTLAKDDVVTPSLQTPLSDGLEITVTRVTYAERTETVVTPCETTYLYSNLLKGEETAVHREGQDGISEITYRDRLEDGCVVSSETLSETTVQESEDRVILQAAATGTPTSEAPYEIPLDENGQPVDYVRVYTGDATSYTGDRGLCGAYTASGRLAQVGVVSVNPNEIPFGTPLYIVSTDGSFVYGYAVAGDTGTAMLSGHTLVDLYMDTLEECCVFGRRQVNVYVLE